METNCKTITPLITSDPAYCKKTSSDGYNDDESPTDALLRLASCHGYRCADKEFARFLDDRDECADFRKEFIIPPLEMPCDADPEIVEVHNGEDNAIYFCGHSLGLQNRRVAKNVNKVISNWEANHIKCYFRGYLPTASCDETVRDGMANLVGGLPTEVALMNGLTINLHLLMVSFYEPTPSRHKIMLEAKAFPSDHYIVESQIKQRGYDPEESMLEVPFDKDYLWDMDEIIRTIEEEGDSIACILLPGVQYLTGQVFDMKRISQAAHSKGCMVGFDLAHAVGNIELFLHDWDVDFASWCNYKYINSGPGAISGAFMHERHKNNNFNKFIGWWGHKIETRFVMNNELDLSPGIDGYRVTNPPPMLCAALQSALDIFNSTTMRKLAKKRFLLTGYLEFLLKHYFSEGKTKVNIVTPSSFEQRGSMLCLRFSCPIKEVFVELEKYGCFVDMREPDIMRVTPAPIYNNFTDVHRFVSTLRILLKNV